MTRKRWIRALERRYGPQNPAVQAVWLLNYFEAFSCGHRVDRKGIEESASHLNEHTGLTMTLPIK